MQCFGNIEGLNCNNFGNIERLNCNVLIILKVNSYSSCLGVWEGRTQDSTSARSARSPKSANLSHSKSKVAWLLTIDYWLLTIDYWLLTIDYWLLTIDYWLLTIDYWLLTFDYWLLTIAYWLVIIDYWLSTNIIDY